MAENTLPEKTLTLLRSKGILKHDEIAIQEGDLTIAINVVTQERRLIEDSPLRESSNKRLLKG